MGSIDEQILKAAKEIVVKFIEGGRISPSGFQETFKNVYRTVEETVKGRSQVPDAEAVKKE
ncbi:MAG: conjugal transfer protein TraB [Desulfobacterales bacterium]|nr:MAG: conjugal transfer protein TraB [Desulfobacterales bacterium]